MFSDYNNNKLGKINYSYYLLITVITVIFYFYIIKQMIIIFIFLGKNCAL